MNGEKKMSPEKKQYWKGLEELHGSEEFLLAHQNEFAEELPVEGYFSEDAQAVGVNRRDFLKMMGFGLAAVSASCSRASVKKAIPYLNKPEELTPGKALWYASSCAGCSAACGVLIKNRDGRPIKLEGLVESPVNRGGLCATGQASILSLYDSGRLQNPQAAKKNTTWADLDKSVMAALAQVKSSGGAVRVVSRTTTSPSTKAAINLFLSAFSDGKHVTYDVASFSAILDVHEKAFGQRALPRPEFSQAEIIVGIDADFLGGYVSPVEYAKGYAQARKLKGNNTKMLEHVQIESRLSLTGANADLRVAARPSQIRAAVFHMLAVVRQNKGGTPLSQLPEIADGGLKKSLDKICKKLTAKNGKSAVFCGINDVDIQSAVLEINARLGNYGATLDMKSASLQKQGSDLALNDFIKDLQAGKISAVVFLDANPAYDLGGRKEFSDALKKVGLTVSLNRYADETTLLCSYAAPDHHYLEGWNDAEPHAGVFQLQQPVINPVYNTRAAQESLLLWSGVQGSFHQFIKDHWQKNIFPRQSGELLFASFWNKSVRVGVVDLSAQANGRRDPDIGKVALAGAPKISGVNGFELEMHESVALRDGAFANNPWLQEMPDPITKVTWDNVATLSPADARKLGVGEGDVVEIKGQNAAVKIPAYILPGQAVGSVSVAIGYGRKNAGKVGSGVGTDILALMNYTDTQRRFSLDNVSISRTSEHRNLACTQTHHSYEGRNIVREMTLAELANGKHVSHAHEDNSDQEMLWQKLPQGQNKWGMAIDMSACTGCSACLIGCQSENNVAVVGREEVFLRREMHWIRLDRYFSGSEENPATVFQPIMCQHCGHAPCESVCPVAATVHSTDGLNQQVYNRCVGTRYCANNCPYKVRRFNWFDYANNPRFDYYMNDNVGKLVLNPDIVVRSRGVMEKCSLCVQRIQEGKLTAKLENRALKDGDIKLACEQSCPSDAIVFGDLADKNSRVAKTVAKNPRRYRVLAELNVQPAVNYLAKVRNT